MLSRCKLFSFFAALALAGSAFSQTVDETQELPDTKVISETFGHLLTKNLETPGFKFDIDSVIIGMQNEANGLPSPLTEEQYEMAMNIIQKRCFEELASANLHQADQFMLENVSNKDVIEVVPEKLHIQVLEEGSGTSVQPQNTPLIHYTGRYLDETVFGSSDENEAPIPLRLDQVIPGFSQGLVGAREGEVRRIYIHPDLGYGTSELMPPNSLLIFDIKVVQADSNPEDVALDTPEES